MNDPIELFKQMFAELTADGVRALGPQIYAVDAHFNDTLADLTGREAILDYLAETAERTEECSATVVDVAHGEDGVYLRWRMRFVAKRLNGGKPIDSMGVSHMRIGDDGLIIDHQDYWDSRANLFEHIPVVGRIIRAVSKRIG